MTAAYPLQWPEGLPRTERRVQSPFKTQLNGALDNVRKSIEAFGSDSGKPVNGIVLSSNVTLGVTSPADPGVAAWFVWDGDQRCIAVDRYPKVQDNLQAIHHIVEARRTEMRHGGLHIVRQTFKGFVALPAPASHDWRKVLGFAPGKQVTATEIDARFRELAAVHHPDKGGKPETMADLNTARDAAKRAVS
jgi:hypothetical protein